MSAASPAHHDGPPPARLAAVVDLTPGARPRRHKRSERTTVPPQPTGPLSDQERLAATLESVWARHGRSLTDDSTATDVRIALGEVRKLLRGARERGLIDEAGFEALDGMYAGIQAAPGLLLGDG